MEEEDANLRRLNKKHHVLWSGSVGMEGVERGREIQDKYLKWVLNVERTTPAQYYTKRQGDIR